MMRGSLSEPSARAATWRDHITDKGCGAAPPIDND
jgi:hypothetical protein